MVINMQVDSLRAEPPDAVEGCIPVGKTSSALAVNEARKAAMRSLLHDFSNVMVGLCSMSENAVDEMEPGSPLHDDMEIIRDSAFKARQIIMRIGTLCGSEEDDDISLVDLVNWLAGEADTFKSMLPKGSSVKLPDQIRTVLVNVQTSRLRDYLITLAALVSRNVGPHRVAMEIELRENDEGCAIRVFFSDLDEQRKALPYSDDETASLDAIAKELGAVFTCRPRTSGSPEAIIVLSSGKIA